MVISLLKPQSCWQCVLCQAFSGRRPSSRGRRPVELRRALFHMAFGRIATRSTACLSGSTATSTRRLRAARGSHCSIAQVCTFRKSSCPRRERAALDEENPHAGWVHICGSAISNPELVFFFCFSFFHVFEFFPEGVRGGRTHFYIL